MTDALETERAKEDRAFQHSEFALLHERLDELVALLTKQQVECERKHRHDDQVLAFIHGGGDKKAAEIRIDRLETAVLIGKWGMGVLGATVLVILGGLFQSIFSKLIHP